MMPLTATPATPAPDEEAKASAVRSGTDATAHGASRSATRDPHITAAPPTYQSRRVRHESTSGAQTNSSVYASVVAAMITADCWSGTPALAQLLPNAIATTPAGHAGQTCRKKNTIGGIVRAR